MVYKQRVGCQFNGVVWILCFGPSRRRFFKKISCHFLSWKRCLLVLMFWPPHRFSSVDSVCDQPVSLCKFLAFSSVNNSFKASIFFVSFCFALYVYILIEQHIAIPALNLTWFRIINHGDLYCILVLQLQNKTTMSTFVNGCMM